MVMLGDVHIYENHVNSVQEQILREPKELPTLKIVLPPCFDVKNHIDNLEITDFTLENYNPHPKIYGKLSTGLK